jgi:hypothetical protein
VMLPVVRTKATFGWALAFDTSAQKWGVQWVHLDVECVS